jgi:hypothetical protein
MNTFALEELAARQPTISCLHVYPGKVITPEFQNADFPYLLKLFLLWVFVPIMRFFTLTIEEVGDRMCFLALSARFPSRLGAADGTAAERMLPVSEGVGVAVGTNGEVGSGAYCVDWTGEVSDNQKRLAELRGLGTPNKIWKHTMEVFDKVS